MKAYKGFNKDMTCRGFQYEEGKTYKTDKAELCSKGFHACENPLDCFNYYAPGKSVYHEVEIDDNGQRQKDNTKVVGKKIKIGAQLSMPMICKLHFEYVTSKCVPAKSNVACDKQAASAGNHSSASAGNYGSASAGNYGSASAGNYGSASAGNHSSASAGNHSSASAGYHSSASAGNHSSASAGNHSSASAGDYGIASAGNCGSASAGDCGSASAGDCGSAVSRGSVSVGENGIALVRGNNVMAKGGIGSILVLCEEDNYNIKDYKVIVIDGKNYKEDTYYTIKDGDIVEVK